MGITGDRNGTGSSSNKKRNTSMTYVIVVFLILFLERTMAYGLAS